MKESDRHCLNEPKLNLNTLELNNNNTNMKMFESNESLISGVSSVASSTGGFPSRRSSEEFDSRSDIIEHPEYNKCERSKSCAGLSEDSSDKEQIDIFPSIPDQLLDEMGLIGDQTRRLQNDEELDQKFATLSLAFSIDSNTIKDRCERQRRYRDQTEKNLAVEIDRLTEKVNSLNKLCVDMETTELLATVLTQIDIVMNASALASSSAERYGAVQHEERLSDAVKLMISHVNSLKQQRDLSRKQLQYTKRVLQDTDSNEGNSMKERRLLQQAQNTKMLTQRRASIAIATLGDQKKNPEKTFTRRTSELNFRTSAVPKLSRPSRMDLGVDLVKIKEGMVEENGYHRNEDYSDSITERDTTGCEDSDEENEEPKKKERAGFNRYIDLFQKKVESTYKTWSEHGTLSNLFYMCSVLCFCFALIVMMDVLFVLELSKR